MYHGLHSLNIAVKKKIQKLLMDIFLKVKLNGVSLEGMCSIPAGEWECKQKRMVRATMNPQTIIPLEVSSHHSGPTANHMQTGYKPNPWVLWAIRAHNSPSHPDPPPDNIPENRCDKSHISQLWCAQTQYGLGSVERWEGI